jgi:ribosomal protein S18 acetylase RimI-like enzyme
MELREGVPASRPDVRTFLEQNGSAVVVRRGELVDVLTRPTVVATEGDDLLGVLTYDIERADCEVLTLHVARQWAGIGTMLVNAAARVATVAGCRRYWVVTTNDNTDALRFYQRRGFRLVDVRRGAVDEARRTLKPQIPALGNYGIPIRDEFELAQDLPLAAPT